MKKPIISIITVSFNASKTIEATIKSVLSQDFKDFEYLIKDGKSKDDTIEIVSKYKKNITKIISTPDKGLYDAMNVAVKEAKGEYIYFLNADDVLKNSTVFSRVSEFLDGKNDLVYGDIEFFYPLEKKSVKVSRIASIGELKKGNMPPHQGSFVKRELLLKYPFDTQYRSSADFDFFSKVIPVCKNIKKVNEIIAVMEMGGISSGKISYLETEKIVKQRFGFLAYLVLLIKHKLFYSIKLVLSILNIKLHKG